MMHKSRIGINHVISVLAAALLLTVSFYGCKSTEVKKEGGLKICDTDIKSKCSGDCVDGLEPKYYFDSRNIQSVKDEADNRIAFLKKQGLGDLDDYPEILNSEKKNASFASYTPPECSGCKPKFTLQGKEAKCEEFYQFIDTLNQRCGGCVEIVPARLKKN